MSAVLCVGTAAVWAWSFRCESPAKQRDYQLPIAIASGGVLIERDVTAALTAGPGFSTTYWSRWGFAYGKFERRILAAERAPGAVALPMPHSAGPDYDRWFYVRRYRA